jgi:hypothetical protein
VPSTRRRPTVPTVYSYDGARLGMER